MHNISYVEVVDPIFQMLDSKEISHIKFESFILFDESYLRIVFIDKASKDIFLF